MNDTFSAATAAPPVPSPASTPVPPAAAAGLSVASGDDASAAPGTAPAPAGKAPADPVLAAFDGWARRAPDAPAVDEHGTLWTYAQLGRAADAVAEALRPRVRPGDVVAMCLDHSALLAATTVALARLGAVQVLLGPRPPAHRLLALADAVRLGCLLGDPGPALPTERSTIEAPAPGTAGSAARVPLAVHVPTGGTGAAGAPAGTRYAVLTSGSTGTPKVVLVGAASLARVAGWYRERAGLGPGERHSLLMHTAFDPHFMEFWATLSAGAALVVAPEEVRSDPAAVTEWWAAAGVTAAVLPTPLGEAVLDRPWPSGLPLRHLVIGGDRLRRWPGPDVTARVDNVYGPAEATIATTFHPLDPAEADGGQAPPIGRPLAGAVVYVTDPAGAVVPRGTPGELRIGGPVLALGYLDERLTRERFVPAPASAAGATAHGRVYRTGDRVVMRPDGVVEFLGRLDDQLKISGVRIEPAEVEAALERDAGVRRAVVAARGDRLLAFVLPAPGAAPDEADLLAAAGRWLPAQVVPSRVRVVDHLPLDANGKVDRGALLAAEERRGDTADTADTGDGADGADGEAATADERRVLAHCRAILDRPALTLEDNFARSGGGSMDVARLLAALEKDSGTRLRAAHVLRQRNLRGIAALLGAARRTGGA